MPSLRSQTSVDADRLSYQDLQQERIVITPYDKAWAQEFKREGQEIARVTTHIPCQFEHVGSTSVPGLCGKPTIDIAIALDSVIDYQSTVDAFESLGYRHYPEYRDWLPEIGLLIKRDNAGRRSHHALVVKANSQVWQDYLDFRNYLIQEPDVAQTYAQLKKVAASRYAHDRLRYNNEKTAFILECLHEFRDSTPIIRH